MTDDDNITMENTVYSTHPENKSQLMRMGYISFLVIYFLTGVKKYETKTSKIANISSLRSASA